MHAFQTHPFSIASKQPLEFIVFAKDGFTKHLHEYAISSPGFTCRASIEGPYGNAPSLKDFDRVVLISGGSGITFTTSMAMGWLAKNQREDSKLNCVWSVRNIGMARLFVTQLSSADDYVPGSLSWLPNELIQLQASSKVKIAVHVTGKGDLHATDYTLSSDNSYREAVIKAGDKEIQNAMQDHVEIAMEDRRILENSVVPGRPNVETIIEDAIHELPSTGRILVAAAGPRGLLRQVEMAVEKIRINAKAPSVRLHLETFC